jgi:transposase
MIDRLIHHAEILSPKADSYRLKNHDPGAHPAEQPTDRSRRNRTDDYSLRLAYDSPPRAVAATRGQFSTGLDEAWWPTLARLRCFRGVDTLTAFALHLELGGDWQRFARANALSAWLGLIPSLHQSGETSHQGAITKTGSGFARRLLVESAWHYGRQPRIGVTLRNRQQGQPEHVLQIANRAQQRLHRVYHRMRARGKPHNVTVVACARELACFLWAAATAG